MHCTRTENQAQFIDSSVKIREGFGFAHPAEQITAVQKYCTAVYGSSLWDLGSPEGERMVIACRTGHKLAWDVPRGCRTYIVQTVLAPHVDSLRACILAREVGFFRGLLTSPSHEVRVLALLAARDVRSNLGSNLALVRTLTGQDPWTAPRWGLAFALEEADRREVPEQDRWRLPYLEKLLTLRLHASYSGEKEEVKRVQSLINSLVIN